MTFGDAGRLAIRKVWRGFRLHWLWLAAIVAGSWIRFYHFRQQILVDDEWHVVHKLLGSSYLSILTDFGVSDFCIPLTLYSRVLADTFHLSETFMRLPSLLAGIAALWIVPWVLGKFVTPDIRLGLAWLLAVSPFHIFFSRVARPYGITLLLGTVAVVAFFRWWQGERGAWGWTYALLGPLATYFSLTAIPALAFPVGYGVLDRFRRSDSGGRSYRELGRLTAVTVGFVLLLLLPPALSASGVVVEKLGQGGVTLETVWGYWQLMLGTIQTLLMVVLLLLAILGCLAGLRDRTRFHLFALGLCVFQVVAVLLMRPFNLQVSVVPARYTILVLPFILLWVASGTSVLGRTVGRWVGGKSTVAAFVVLVFVLIFGGPQHQIYFYPNNWTNQHSYQYDYDPNGIRREMQPESISSFYEELRQFPPGTRLVVEAPWYYNWHFYPYYQRRHRQRVVLGFVDRSLLAPVRNGEVPAGDPRVAFTNALHVADLVGIVRKGAHFVILHKRLHEEMPGPFPQKPVDVSQWVDLYRASFGKPTFEDSWIVVFDVSREPDWQGATGALGGLPPSEP